MNNKTSHLLAGGVTGGVLVLINVIFIVFDLTGNTKVSWIGSVINIGLLVYFILEFGKQQDHTKSFGELFSYGFKATAFTTIILTAFMVIYSFAFPNAADEAMEIAREQMSNQPNMSEETIDSAIEMTRKFYFPILIGGTIFGTMLVGAIGALIGAAVTKKNPSHPFQNQ
jgi:hypothetical protein